MKLCDIDSGAECSLEYLKEEWSMMRKGGEECAGDFKTHLLETLLATVNGRNDCDIDGLTNREIDRYIRRLRKAVL